MKWCSSCDAIGHDHQSDAYPQAPPRKNWAGEDQKKGVTWGGYRRQQCEMICWDFNRGHCRFGNQCKYRHMCECGGCHPSIRCPRHENTRLQTRSLRRPLAEKEYHNFLCYSTHILCLVCFLIPWVWVAILYTHLVECEINNSWQGAAHAQGIRLSYY